MSERLSSVHAKVALVAAIATGASLPLGSRIALGVALGGALQLVGLRLLERGVTWMLGLAGQGQGGVAAVLVVLRLVGVLAAAALILVAFPVHPLAFAFGFSTAVPALLWHGLAQSREGEG